MSSNGDLLEKARLSAQTKLSAPEMSDTALYGHIKVRCNSRHTMDRDEL